MSVITTGNFPKELWPGLNKTWGLKYNEYPPEYMELFDKSSSMKAYEEDVGNVGFGLVPAKPEGTATLYDDMRQTFVSRYTHVTYALGFIITYEEIKDNLYMDVGIKGTKNLAFAYNQTRENIGANVYNNAFSSSYPGGDGVSLLNSAHPINGGTFSNILAVSTDLSEASLEQLIINIGLSVDPRGLKIKLIGKSLHVPIQLQFEAKRILGDSNRPGTADRDINAMYHMNMIPEGFKVNHYFTNQNAYFIRTNAEDGLRYFEREAVRFSEDNEFDTENAKYKCMGRYSFGWTDPRALFGTAGY
jgi:hypothetical protein